MAEVYRGPVLTAVILTGVMLAGTLTVGAARVGANGLELAAADGAVFPLGGAPGYGSMGGKTLSKPITRVSTTPAGDATGWPAPAASSPSAVRPSSATR